MKKTKALALALMIVFVTGTASAAIEEVNIVNLFPDSDNRFRDTHVVTRLQANSTTDTEAHLWVETPDGTVFQADDSVQLRVKQGDPREIVLELNDENISDYGEFMLKVNETSAGIQDNITTEVIPQADIELQFPDDVILDDREFITVNVNTRQGDTVDFDEIENPTLELSKITDDPDTEVVEKQLFLTTEMAEDNLTLDLEKNIDISNFTIGTYEANLEFNITACDSCEKYFETESEVFKIEDDAMTNTAAVLGLAAIPFLFILLLREFKQADDMMEEAGLTLAMLFVIGLTYTGHGIASSNSLGNAADAYLVAALVSTLVFIGVLIEMVNGYRRKTQEDNEFGYFGR